MIALMLTIELLSFAPESKRAADIFRALKLAAPKTVDIRSTASYHGGSDVLMLWGPGSPDRFPPMAAQLANGGHILALDLAYWHRDTKFRVSIDAAHPQQWVMRRDWPASRFQADRVRVAETWNPNGPIIIAGIGHKARVQYGDCVERWERSMIAAVRSRWPARRVLYRRKRQDSPTPSGVDLATNKPIDDLLSGASLLATWHSNVAVDAIRLGIPTICVDGAAAAVGAPVLRDEDPQPLAPETRDRFLRNLAWFQWQSSQAADFWAWVPEVLA